MMPDLDSEQIAALQAVHELELVLKVRRMPCLVVIGLPGKNEFVRFSGGLDDADTCAAFRIAANAYLDKFHGAPEAGRLDPETVIAIAKFHATAAAKLLEKAAAERAPMDSPLRRNALFHQTTADKLAAHAQTLQ